MGDFMASLEQLPVRDYAAGEVIIHEGKPAGGLYFLESGTVSVTKDGEEIHKINVPGAIFGEMSYLLDCDATATVTAHTDCGLRIVEDHGGFIGEHPETALYIARILAARLDSVVRYLVDLKAQFRDQKDHLGMVDDIIDSIITRHPRSIEKSLRSRDMVDD